MTTYDLVLRGGTVGTAGGTFRADVAVKGETIVALGNNLAAGTREIDATGKLVLPGGIDAHAHIEQLSGMGVMNADTFASGTAAAALGGTTTVIPFAAQHQGKSLAKVVEDYHVLAKRGAVIDYAMHMIIADPTEKVLTEELPALIKSGHGSIKVFMTYEKTKVDDEQLLDVLLAARTHKALVCVHAENNGMISWMGRRLVGKGYTAPKYHTVYHPRLAEAEAFHRLIACAELLDQPIIIYHVSTAEGAAVIREARGRGLKVFGETCTQYLLLTRGDLDKPGLDGAKWVCSPPLRTERDQEALWRALDLGDLQFVSSDHAPYTLDDKGKFLRGPNPPRTQTAAAVRCDRLEGPLRRRAIRGVDGDRTGAHVWARSEEGQHRDRCRCRHLRMGSQTKDRNRRCRCARWRGLHALYGAYDHRLAGRGDAARRRHRRGWEAQRVAGLGPLPAARSWPGGGANGAALTGIRSAAQLRRRPLLSVGHSLPLHPMTSLGSNSAMLGHT